MILKDYLKRNKRLIDYALKKYLPPSNSHAPVFHRAIKYSLFPAGKRLRPLLAIAAYKACGGEGKEILPFACALEMIHTSFLIHDDLPAMDNDTYRRARLTVHKKFGEAAAILAGDGLLMLAFSVMSQAKDSKLTLGVIREISEAIGVKGVVGGQAAEMENRSRQRRTTRHTPPEVSSQQRTLKYIYTHKTAALIKTAVVTGAIVAGANKRRIDSLAKFGRDFGLSFQYTDDILDNNGYARILGKKEAKKKAASLTRQAIKHLECFGSKADALREIATFCLNRR